VQIAILTTYVEFVYPPLVSFHVSNSLFTNCSNALSISGYVYVYQSVTAVHVTNCTFDSVSNYAIYATTFNGNLSVSSSSFSNYLINNVYVVPSSTTSAVNLTFNSCSFNSISSRQYALIATNLYPSSLTVNLLDCKFFGNNYGAFISQANNLVVSDTSFQETMFNALSLNSVGTAIITHSIFSNNFYPPLVANLSTIALQSCQFLLNNFSSSTSSNVGGALSFYNSTATMLDCIVSKNEAKIGGAFYLFGSTLVLKNSQVSQNTAVNGSFMYCDNSLVVLENSTYIGTTAGANCIVKNE